MEMSFVVPGHPVPKARARVSFRNGKAHAHTPAKTQNFEATVRLCAASARPSGWPLRARYALHLGVFLPHERGDLDNYLKSVGDACNGILWHDDSVKYVGEVSMLAAIDQVRPRVEVRLVATPAHCKLVGCGHAPTLFPDDEGRCEDCSTTTRSRARSPRARRTR